MGHAHGTKWTDEMVESQIQSVMKALNLTRMPSRSEIELVTKSSKLTNKISKTGGFYKWADILGLEIKDSDTLTGIRFENEISEFLNSKGYDVELTSVKHPYDILVNESVKIDTKYANLYESNIGNFYIFNLEKKSPTCDIYVCCCVDKSLNKKMYIIPSKFLNIKTLSIGEFKSKYNRFIDRWDYIAEYDKFYSSIV